MFPATLFPIKGNGTSPDHSHLDDWMDKENMVHIDDVILLSCKEK